MKNALKCLKERYRNQRKILIKKNQQLPKIDPIDGDTETELRVYQNSVLYTQFLMESMEDLDEEIKHNSENSENDDSEG